MIRDRPLYILVDQIKMLSTGQQSYIELSGESFQDSNLSHNVPEFDLSNLSTLIQVEDV